ETPGPALGVAPAADEARLFQHLEVLRDRGLAHREGLCELGHRRLPGRKTGQNRSPRGIGEGGESGIAAFSYPLFITTPFHNSLVIYDLSGGLSSPSCAGDKER